MADGARRVDARPDLAGAGWVPPVLERRYAIDVVAESQRNADVLVVGTGIAGLVAALEIAALGRHVTLVTKTELRETGTWYAQGGIAGAVGEADSVELHLADTLVVGQGICDEAVVRAVVEEAPEALRDLKAFGVSFDLADGGSVALAREGGHSLPRVLHSGDATGAAIHQALTRAVRARADIEVLEHRFLVDLLTEGDVCTGAVFFADDGRRVEAVRAEATVLATGGLGQLYRVTTNPSVATGDGVAAAWRAGADLSDLEFVQFHPTALDHEAEPRFLITEALRGEGAYLRDCEGERFMVDAHPLAELAPRDVVSREIERVMTRCGTTSVWLDARHLGDGYLAERFPNIFAACERAGWHLGRDLVPVAPAAHYAIGGIRTDLDGRTSVRGLFASGEVACTGLHGANRLASNSLLEGLVFSRRIARAVAEGRAFDVAAAARRWPTGAESVATAPSDESEVDGQSADLRRALRETMSAHVAVGRDDAGVSRALRVVTELADALCSTACDDRAHVETADMLTVAALLAGSAHARTETRGAHARADFPERDDLHWRGHIVVRRGAHARFVPIQTMEDHVHAS